MDQTRWVGETRVISQAEDRGKPEPRTILATFEIALMLLFLSLFLLPCGSMSLRKLFG